MEEGGEEDEGWLMDFVYFPSNHSSAWVVWDARHLFDFNHHIDQFHYHLLFVIHTRDLSRVATVHLPQRVPYGVHGLWLEKEFLDSRQNVN